jgi:hypothetical protein
VPLPWPYKRTPTPTEHSHTIGLSPPPLCRAHAIALLSQSSVAIALPPHRCSSSGEQFPSHTASPPSRGHPRGKPSWPGAAARPSSGEPPPRPCLRSTGDQRRPWSMNHGPSPRLFPLENNSKPNIPCLFAKRPLILSNINPQSTKILRRPLVFETFLKRPLATSRNYKKVPATSFRHIFTTVTLILAILVPKFSESLPLSSYAFINTCLLHID